MATSSFAQVDDSTPEDLYDNAIKNTYWVYVLVEESVGKFKSGEVVSTTLYHDDQYPTLLEREMFLIYKSDLTDLERFYITEEVVKNEKKERKVKIDFTKMEMSLTKGLISRKINTKVKLINTKVKLK